MILKLTADSRSNEDANFNQWTYGSYSTTFTNFRWNAVSGWGHNQLNIEKGSRITIDCYPFRGKTSTELSHFGAAVEIVFELNNVDDNDAVIARINNGTNKAGVIVKATEASLYMDGDIVGVSTKYNPRGRRMLTFIVNRNATTVDKDILYIVNNGVVERSTSFSSSDSININQPIVIGSDQADVILHSVRVYSDAISVENALGNYVVMSPDMLSIAYRNNVLANGVVSYNAVKNFIPTFKITCLEGYNMDIINNATTKKANIRADIEYTNPFDNTLNFTVKTAYICPQGTSSLSYPIKNLRLYTGTKKEPDCKMYDADGNQIAGGKYAFRHGSQPVDCWTLKADYAESSMSHNTGTAKLWNDSMKTMKVNLGTHGDVYVCQTRAQRAALANNYKQDVRTAIDGFPCVVFYQNSIADELIYMGQFNFNNDKSTESVFGFKDITVGGNKIFDASDVECWEFTNNAHRLGLFTATDFTTPEVDEDGNECEAWQNAFEGRYPDGNTDTTHLYAFAQWVNGVSQANFATQKWEHLDVWKVAAYYVYLMRHGAVDQVVKNAMLDTEGYEAYNRNGDTYTSSSKLWFFILYDNDTIHGVINSGELALGPRINRDTQTLSGTYDYAGHESRLWNLLDNDTEFIDTIVPMVDSALYSATPGISYDSLIRMYDDEQSSKWSERLYNFSQEFKYVKQYRDKDLSNYLKMLQGTRQSHRQWWLTERYALYNGMWASTGFRDDSVQFTVYATPATTFTITAADDLYYGWGTSDHPMLAKKYMTTAESWSIPVEANPNMQSSPAYIYGLSRIGEIDLSNFSQLMRISFARLYDSTNDEVKPCRLRKLVLGKSGATNTLMSSSDFAGLGYLTALEELDVQGITNITSLNIDTLYKLKKLNASGTHLGAFHPAPGVIMEELILPSTISEMTLIDFTFDGEAADFQYTPNSTLRHLSLQNFAGGTVISAYNIIETWIAALIADEVDFGLCSLQANNISWTMTSTEFVKYCDFSSIILTGIVNITSADATAIKKIYDTFGEDCFLGNADLVINVTAAESYAFYGPTNVLEGTDAEYMYTRWPMHSDDEVTYQLCQNTGSTVTEGWTYWPEYSGTIDPATGLTKYTVGNIVFYSDGTLYTTEENQTSTTVRICATHNFRVSHIYNSQTRYHYKDYTSVTVNKVTYPTTATITVSNRNITQTGTYEFPLAFNPAYTGHLDSATVSLTNAASGTAISSAVATASVSDDFKKVTMVVKDVVNTFKVTISVTATHRTGTATGSNYVYLRPEVTGLQIDQSILDADSMIQRTGLDDFIAYIRNNTHRYLGKTVEDNGNVTMHICRLNDSDSTKYFDNSTAVLNGDEGNVFVKLPVFYYKFHNETQVDFRASFSVSEPVDWNETDHNGWKKWEGDNTLIGAYKAWVNKYSVANPNNYYQWTTDKDYTYTYTSGSTSETRYYFHTGEKYQVKFDSKGRPTINTNANEKVSASTTQFQNMDIEAYESDNGASYFASYADKYTNANGSDTVQTVSAANRKIYSISGVRPSKVLSRNNFQTYLRNMHTGYGIVSWDWHCMLAILFYVLYGHTNSQSRIGSGDNTYGKVTGVTNGHGVTDGQWNVANGSDGSYAQSVNFLGVENWWGDIWEWMEGGYVYNAHWYAPNVLLQDPSYTEHSSTGSFDDRREMGTAATQSGYISQMVFGPYGDLVPNGVAGTASTGFCDYYYYASGLQGLFRSFHGTSPYGGVSCVHAYYDASYAYWSRGSRLSFHGNVVDVEKTGQANPVTYFKSIPWWT